MGFLWRLLYPLFGIFVLVAYTHVVRSGIEPFSASSQSRRAPVGAHATGGGHRPRGVFIFGGFGGK